ncbi:hypothetical protein ZIOFF_022328 [Zingiber officinale]|uniref:Uncharacterized protein n=1 Tax=Zingiber officinale TaxID=94328 RepID=A0A8J5HCT7_ZINOF|nr:hypothetical protein ZIOFF_022328 [Zingiber officinale]
MIAALRHRFLAAAEKLVGCWRRQKESSDQTVGDQTNSLKERRWEIRPAAARHGRRTSERSWSRVAASGQVADDSRPRNTDGGRAEKLRKGVAAGELTRRSLLERGPLLEGFAMEDDNFDARDHLDRFEDDLEKKFNLERVDELNTLQVMEDVIIEEESLSQIRDKTEMTNNLIYDEVVCAILIIDSTTKKKKKKKKKKNTAIPLAEFVATSGSLAAFESSKGLTLRRCSAPPLAQVSYPTMSLSMAALVTGSGSSIVWGCERDDAWGGRRRGYSRFDEGEGARLLGIQI